MDISPLQLSIATLSSKEGCECVQKIKQIYLDELIIKKKTLFVPTFKKLFSLESENDTLHFNTWEIACILKTWCQITYIKFRHSLKEYQMLIKIYEKNHNTELQVKKNIQQNYKDDEFIKKISAAQMKQEIHSYEMQNSLFRYLCEPQELCCLRKVFLGWPFMKNQSYRFILKAPSWQIFMKEPEKYICALLNSFSKGFIVIGISQQNTFKGEFLETEKLDGLKQQVQKQIQRNIYTLKKIEKKIKFIPVLDPSGKYQIYDEDKKLYIILIGVKIEKTSLSWIQQTVLDEKNKKKKKIKSWIISNNKSEVIEGESLSKYLRFMKIRHKKEIKTHEECKNCTNHLLPGFFKKHGYMWIQIEQISNGISDLIKTLTDKSFAIQKKNIYVVKKSKKRTQNIVYCTSINKLSYQKVQSLKKSYPQFSFMPITKKLIFNKQINQNERKKLMKTLRKHFEVELINELLQFRIFHESLQVFLAEYPKLSFV